ncbi:MAG TPA: cation-transporting P-type ATPase, partial [Syntrophales bacterium]|nr:cation-transporting P-type ATPase [Syntrophales bacterium]
SVRRQLRKMILQGEEQPSDAWHGIEAPFALSRLDVNRSDGLTREQYLERLKKYGPNILPESVPRSGLSIFVEQFKSMPVALLSVAAAISVATGGLVDAIVIMSVVMINSVIGYATESNSERTINSLKKLVRPTALVLRAGSIETLSTENVVPGDLLVLRPGSYVAADARLIEAQRLTVDESTLTGESLPVVKKTEAILSAREVPLADRTNMVYMGTLVTGGQGLAVVIATGQYTEIGNIQRLAGEVRPPATPMERQLDEMGGQLVAVSGITCGIVFVIGMLRGYGFLEMLKSSISLAVAAVPEGLPAVATTTLALGLRNMRKHHVLMRHLEAVETLGSIQTICLDKTGTLTENRMSVQQVYAGMRRFRVSDGKFMDGREPVSPFGSGEILQLLRVSVLCNESEIIRNDGTWVVNGTATENALIHLALCAGVDALELRENAPRRGILHRSEGQNIMLTLHTEGGGRRRSGLCMKGSPQEVLARCGWHMRDGRKRRLRDEDRMAIEVENEHLAGLALRVLAVACSDAAKDLRLDGEEIPGQEFTWLGMVGMADPVRPGVESLIASFHTAGIDTVMITGDQSPTAYAIGKELNLSRGEQLEIVDSTNLADMPPDVLRALCERVHVFSRVSPAHKLQIVQSLQSVGRVIAMTGDGINDGPALKSANVGVAMGKTGTDVAREVADVVLEDDNLQTMLVAISQGRTIYNNIRKSIHYLLSTNMSEIMVMFAGISLGLGQPLTAMQLLWINLITDIFPGLALALEPPEPDVMSQPPRDPGEPIVMPSDFKRLLFESSVISAGSLAAFGYGIVRYGRGPQASSIAFLSLTCSQLLHALSCRSKRHSIFERDGLPPNPWLTGALAGSFAVQGLAMLVPGVRGLLGIAPIGLIDCAVIGGGAVLPLLVSEVSKGTAKGNNP